MSRIEVRTRERERVFLAEWDGPRTRTVAYRVVNHPPA